VKDHAGAIGLVGLGACLAVGLVFSASIASQAIVQIKRDNQALEVKGFAERGIESDLATWKGSYTNRARQLTEAYAALESDRKAMLDFLEGQKVPASAHELLPVTMRVLYGRNDKGMQTNEIEGYALTQQVRVSSKDIDLISRLSKESGALVKQGVEFSSHQPEFLYTGLGELKIEMLAEATADARRRAETLAEQSGGTMGPLLSARQGVFQITAAHSTEVSDYGRNDTTSRQKSIKAVVTVRFAVGR
jgi:hypothetical protein